MLFAKNHFYSLIVITIAIFFTSCNNTFNSVVPPPPTNSAQPMVQPIRFSKAKKIAWADVKAEPARPVVTTLAWDKLPEQAEDTTGFGPFKYPVQEARFDYNSLPAKDLDIDKLPSIQLKFKTYVLPQPKLIKGAKLQIKNGNLYVMVVGEDQSSSDFEVTRLLHDGDGFLWIACNQGVYRFDGENLLSFLSFRDEQTDFGMMQDSLGNIWLPNPAGQLMILDTKAGILKKAVPNQGLDSLQHLMPDQQQRIWATSQSGDLKIIDNKAQTVKILNKKNGLFTTNRTAGITQDRSGKIWISTGGGGINIIDQQSKTIKHLDQAHGLKSDRVNNIFLDRRGRLWVGMFGGLVHVIDFGEKSIQTISEIQPPAGGVLVSCLTEDDQQRVWIGTTGSGATAIDLENRRVMHLTKNNGLVSNEVYDINRDDDGQIWLATSLGLNMAANKRAVAEHADNNWIVNLMEDSHGLIWEATENNGVDILDRKKKTIRHLDAKQGIANNNIHFIEEMSQRVYISTDSSLEVLDTAKKTISHFKSSYGNILFDKMGRIWFLDKTETGINLYDPKNQTIRHLGKELLQLNGDAIYFMCLDAHGRIWLSNSYGEVGIVDPEAGTFQYLSNIKRDRSRSSVHFLLDGKGNIWMGTDRGVFIADLKNQTVVYFSAAQGLINNKVLSMAQFKGSVYAGTDFGITVITPPAEGVSAKRSWRAVSYPNNKQYTNNYNADMVTADGIYWSGDRGATALDLTKIAAPKSVPYIKGISLYDHPVYFFDKTRFNRSATDTLWQQNGETWFLEDQTPVNTSYAFKSGLQWDNVTAAANTPVDLQIPHNQNFIHFHYGNLNLVPHDTTYYRYILSGVDEAWSNVTSDTSTVNYMNLQSGSYTFEVISKGPDNVWSRPAILNFTINPPWWQTWWAYLIYLSGFAGGIWSFVQYRSRQLLKEKRVLEDKVLLATEEIVQQKEEIAVQRDSLESQRNDLEKTLVELKATQTQLIQSEKMASLGELTAGIAHEIQNPLNFVNNFSEVSIELLQELQEEAKAGHTEDVIEIAAGLAQNLEKINHHGKRADSIVKGMLEHSRTRSGQKELTDINTLTDEYLRLSYHGLRAKNKNFNAEMTKHFDDKLPKINVIPQDIGRVLLNLFNNAFYAVNQKQKTTNADYKPEVSVYTSTENGQVIIKVNDNGVGMPEHVKEKIMQPFFTTKPTGEGTGLGLSLTYDMVVKGHGGSIQVNSVEGEGSEFIINLPSG